MVFTNGNATTIKFQQFTYEHSSKVNEDNDIQRVKDVRVVAKRTFASKYIFEEIAVRERIDAVFFFGGGQRGMWCFSES